MVTVEVLVSLVDLDRVRIAVLVELNIMTVIYQPLECCHQEQQVVK